MRQLIILTRVRVCGAVIAADKQAANKYLSKATLEAFVLHPCVLAKPQK
jgi:hypothetical protein